MSAVKERVLVVDDSVSTLEVLKRNLAAAGYHVFTAQSVSGAIEILEQTPLDLVITDLRCPTSAAWIWFGTFVKISEIPKL